MVCEKKISELEKRLKRKLTPQEKKRIEELMHHNESHSHEQEEEPICA